MMKHTTKTGMKRKIELNDTKANNVVNNRAKTAIKPKAPLKADLIVKMKELQDKFDTLKIENIKNIDALEMASEVHEETNKMNLEIIKQLRDKLNQFETEKEPNTNMKCEECDFMTRSKTELSWHLCEDHGWPLDRSPNIWT